MGVIMYFISKCNNNLTYSIDMIRLRTDLTVGDFSKFKLKMMAIYKDYLIKEWVSTAISDFRYNFTVEIEEGKSFWFGFFHNSDKRHQSEKGRYNLTLEFNPNKLKNCNLIFDIIHLSNFWTLKQFDIAIDVPYSILDICGINKKRFKDVRVFSAGYDDKTIYLGRSNNRVKIYNKKRESNINMLGELTRIEITHACNYNFSKYNTIFKPDIKLPELYLSKFLITREPGDDDISYNGVSDGDKTLLALLFAVQNGYCLHDLSRQYRNKVESLLKGDCLISFDFNCIYSVLNETLIFYLG